MNPLAELAENAGAQEAEKEINFVRLRAYIDDAIKAYQGEKNKKIFAIEAIDAEKQEKELKYMQKYAESCLSKYEFNNGNFGIGLAVAAIGASYILAATADVPNKPMLEIGGFLLVIFGIVIIFWAKQPWRKKHEFIHEIILKIEEKLLNRN